MVGVGYPIIDMCHLGLLCICVRVCSCAYKNMHFTGKMRTFCIVRQLSGPQKFKDMFKD